MPEVVLGSPNTLCKLIGVLQETMILWLCNFDLREAATQSSVRRTRRRVPGLSLLAAQSDAAVGGGVTTTKEKT